MSLICCSCQFIVRDGADYMVHTADPDTLVSWDLIEQVVGPIRLALFQVMLVVFLVLR